jgi:fumarate hydratase class I
MYKEVNTGTNLPAQIDIYASEGNAYKFHFIAKGGGSANKTYLYQQTKALLNPDSLMKFVNENIRFGHHTPTRTTAHAPPHTHTHTHGAMVC